MPSPNHDKHVASNSSAFALNLFRGRYSWKAGKIQRTIFTHFFHMMPMTSFSWILWSNAEYIPVFFVSK